MSSYVNNDDGFCFGSRSYFKLLSINTYILSYFKLPRFLFFLKRSCPENYNCISAISFRFIQSIFVRLVKCLCLIWTDTTRRLYIKVKKSYDFLGTDCSFFLMHLTSTKFLIRFTMGIQTKVCPWRLES